MKIEVLHAVMSEISESEKQALQAHLNKIADKALALLASKTTPIAGGILSGD